MKQVMIKCKQLGVEKDMHFNNIVLTNNILPHEVLVFLNSHNESHFLLSLSYIYKINKFMNESLKIYASNEKFLVLQFHNLYFSIIPLWFLWFKWPSSVFGAWN